jgi:hypothetical protein
MSLINIIILVILALVLLWGLNNIFLKTNIIYDKMCEASAESTETDAVSSSKNIIAAKDLPETTSSNFTLSVWFYIDNWGNDIGNEKNILFMATNHTARTFQDFIEATTSFSGISTYKSTGPPASPTIYKNINIALDKYENNLFIDIECFPDRQSAANSTPNQTIYARYKIPNVSVQKWNNLTISVDGRTLDVYLDGKLRNSFILHGLYKNFYSNNAKKNIYLGTLPGGTTSNGNRGFEGFITRVRFEGDSCNPQDAYNIYKEGIDASLANSIFNKYSLKVSFLEYNKEKGSFKI